MTSVTRQYSSGHRWVRKALREIPHQIARAVEEFDLRAERWQPGPGEWSAHQAIAFLLESEREDAPAVEAILARDGAAIPERRAYLLVEEREYPRSMDSLLYDFYELRQEVLWNLEYAEDSPAAEHTGTHPYLGRVTLAQFLREMSDRDMEVLLQLQQIQKAVDATPAAVVGSRSR